MVTRRAYSGDYLVVAILRSLTNSFEILLQKIYSILARPVTRNRSLRVGVRALVPAMQLENIFVRRHVTTCAARSVPTFVRFCADGTCNSGAASHGRTSEIGF